MKKKIQRVIDSIYLIDFKYKYICLWIISLLGHFWLRPCVVSACTLHLMYNTDVMTCLYSLDVRGLGVKGDQIVWFFVTGLFLAWVTFLSKFRSSKKKSLQSKPVCLLSTI